MGHPVIFMPNFTLISGSRSNFATHFFFRCPEIVVLQQFPFCVLVYS